MNRLLISAVLWLMASCAQQGNLLGADARTAGNRVADWQLAHMADFDYVRTFREQTGQRAGWIQAAFYIGLARWASVTGDDRYTEAVLQNARENRWQIGPLYWHADDQAIAQVYLFLAERAPDAKLDAVKRAFDRILAAPPTNSLAFEDDQGGNSEGACQRRWCWCDALFMAPPAWAGLSRITGDSRYLDYALSEYATTVEFLYDREEHLFYRDSRFFEQRTRWSNKVFWSRGNGWVFAGLPLLIETMPPGRPERDRLLRLFVEMAQKFRTIQHPDGYWTSSLLDFAQDQQRETSGTAFITFGLAWGVNHGVLAKVDYEQTIRLAWQALSRAVDASGRPGWVQQVGDAPDQVRKSDTQLYGSGALLLAASELLRWQDRHSYQLQKGPN